MCSGYFQLRLKANKTRENLVEKSDFHVYLVIELTILILWFSEITIQAQKSHCSGERIQTLICYVFLMGTIQILVASLDSHTNSLDFSKIKIFMYGCILLESQYGREII